MYKVDSDSEYNVDIKFDRENLIRILQVIIVSNYFFYLIEL